MYLFQQLPARVCALWLLHLHSTMYLFQPAAFMIFLSTSVIYIPLCIYFNPDKYAHLYLSWKHLHSTMYLFQQSYPLFHGHFYRYLHSTMYLFQRGITAVLLRLYFHLHSTMYLFQPVFFNPFISPIFIYIPLCIYFNPVLYSPALIQQLHLLFCRSLSLYRFYHKFLLVITSFSHIRLCNLY